MRNEVEGRGEGADEEVGEECNDEDDEEEDAVDGRGCPILFSLWFRHALERTEIRSDFYGRDLSVER